MTVRTTRWLAAALLGALAAGSASARELWRIGEADDSYAEFAIAGEYGRYAATFPGDVTYDVATARPGVDWPFIQPGPADAWAGGREHPFRIRFDLATVPERALVLAIDLVGVQRPVSATLALAVNGEKGEYELRPGPGDAVLTDPAAGEEQVVEAFLDPEVLRAGGNEITLMVRGSWVLYDAISLRESEAGVGEPKVESLTLEQTQLLKRLPGGALGHVVYVTVRAPGGQPVRLAWRAGEGASHEVVAQGGVRFGDLRSELLVPEVRKATTLAVTARTAKASAEATLTLEPVRHWRIYVAAASHTDIGYTDLQEKCTERHVENADVALELCREFAGFGWNLETAWQADEYLRRRSPEQAEALFALAREGRVGIQANYLNMLTGLCSHEELNRWLSFAHRLHREHGVPFESATITDVPTQVWSIPTTLAAAGIRYYATGINNDRGYPFRQQMVGYPYWWEGPDGSRVLAYFSPQYAHGAGPLASRGALEGWLRQALADKGEFPYDALFLYGLVSDNQPVAQGVAGVATAWNEEFAFPRVIVGPYAQYLRYMDETYGDTLPVLRGDPGVYWEDGAASSARETAENRNAHETASAAESLHGLTRWATTDLESPAPTAEFAELWRTVLLYDEHTWGAHNSIREPDSEFVRDQWNVKASFAREAASRAGDLLESGLRDLAYLVPSPGPAILVYNATSWPRVGGVVRARIPNATVPTDPTTGEALPTAVLAETRAGSDVVFRVPSVPAWGYLVCPLVEGRGVEPVTEEMPASLETRLGGYRLRFSAETGAVLSLYDEAAGRELADPSAPYGINEYLYVSGGDDSDIVSLRNRTAQLTVHRTTAPSFRRTVYPGLGESVTVFGSCENTPQLAATYTAWEGSDGLEIENRLERTDERRKEATYFAFPFQVTAPEVRTEIPNGVVRAGPDQLPGGCTEWFCTEHWVRVAGEEGSVAWSSPDAPLFCVDDINRGLWPGALEVREGWLYSYAMNNYWHTNYKASQDGSFVFRFALRGVRDDAEAARFGWQQCMPLRTTELTEESPGFLPAAAASLCRVVGDRVAITAIKPAEEGRGLVVRLFSYDTKPVDAVLDLGPAAPRGATLATLMEEPIHPLEVAGSRVRAPGIVPLRPVTVVLR